MCNLDKTRIFRESRETLKILTISLEDKSTKDINLILSFSPQEEKSTQTTKKE
jgi:hypothetical protein